MDKILTLLKSPLYEDVILGVQLIKKLTPAEFNPIASLARIYREKENACLGKKINFPDMAVVFYRDGYSWIIYYNGDFVRMPGRHIHYFLYEE